MGIKPRKQEKGAIRPTRSDEPSPDSLYISFNLKHVEGKHCLTRCNKNELTSFAKKIRTLSKMTWAQIKAAPKHGLGSETISSLKEKLPKEARDKDRDAIALRFEGKKPMVGYRGDRDTFYVVWFDRDFKLYDHGS